MGDHVELDDEKDVAKTIRIPTKVYRDMEKACRQLCGVTPAHLVDWCITLATAHADARIKSAQIDTRKGAARQTIHSGYTVTQDSYSVRIPGRSHAKLKAASEVLGLTMPTLVLDMWRLAGPAMRMLPTMGEATTKCIHLKMALAETRRVQGAG